MNILHFGSDYLPNNGGNVIRMRKMLENNQANINDNIIVLTTAQTNNDFDDDEYYRKFNIKIVRIKKIKQSMKIIQEICKKYKIDVNRFALPNKFYEGILAGKPVVTTNDNYSVSKYIKEYNLGIIIDDIYIDRIGESIITNMKKFDYDKFEKGRVKFIKDIIEEQHIFSKKISEFTMR